MEWFKYSYWVEKWDMDQQENIQLNMGLITKYTDKPS